MGDEAFRWQGRCSMRTAFPALSFFEALTVASVAVPLALHWAELRAVLPLAVLCQLISLAIFLRAWLAAISHQYSIDGDIVTLKTGLLSRRMEQVNVRDIRSVDLAQPFGQRLLGVGTVMLSTASEPMVFRNVVDPDGVIAAIHRLRRG